MFIVTVIKQISKAHRLVTKAEDKMDRDKAKEIMPIMQAYINGADIQYQDNDEGWLDVDDPMFAEDSIYRIKPEPIERWIAVYDVESKVEYSEEHYSDKNSCESACANHALFVKAIKLVEPTDE